MAATNQGSAPTETRSAPRPRVDHPRGGGRGRGYGDQDGLPRQQQDGRGGRRRGGQARGGAAGTRANGGVMNTTDLTQRFSQVSTQIGLIKNATEGVKPAEGEEEDAEAEVCFICASPVVHHSVAPCNHRTCHICALRMRALYKTKDCAHCRTPAPYVIFTDNASMRFEDFTNADFVSRDDNIGIKYENAEIVEDTLLLLRYNCPDPSCDVACLGWPDLHRHVRSVHHKKMCDLCTRNKKVFTHEHELFTDKELERHMKKGDDNPGAIDQSGFRGHPLCGFCGERFYGDDELYVHCRAKHERCFICDRREGRQPQYYLNYDSLEIHFRKDHFLCSERDCLEKKFIVFPSELDLKAHQLQEHGNTLSKDVRRDVRVVDISSFDYRAPYVQERRGGGSQRENRGRGRGRDPNTEPIPPSSAQPLRRDEQAFQRQMAIQSAQSVSTRTFGGQLTQSAPAARAFPAAREPPTVTAPHSAPHVDTLVGQLSGIDLVDNAANTPEEQARRLRHSAVIERASSLLQNDLSKMVQFRTSVSSYRTGSITATALIDSFFALFSDTSSTALGSLVRDVADLYEDTVKSAALRTAWNDWRAINEDYPSLPGPSGLSSTIPLGWAQVTASTPSTAPIAPKSTSRVLKLKSSTVQSSRSSASRNASWGTASAVSATPFPGLPAATSANRIGASRVNTIPWVNPTPSQSNPSSAPASARPTPPTSRPASRNIGGAGGGGDMFPALPPAKKPTTTIFGYGTGMVRRDAGGSVGGYTWGAGSGGANGSGGNSGVEDEGDVQTGKKKGNKGKKQVVLQWG